MKKSICFILIISIFLLISACHSSIEQNSFVINELEVNTHNFEAAQPDFSNGKLVWSGGNDRESLSMFNLDKIFLYDIDSKHITTLYHTELNGQSDETQINNNWICWTDWNKSWDIYGYSIKNKEHFKIASSDNNSQENLSDFPRLTLSSNNYLAWFETDNISKQRTLKLYNIETRKEEDITKIEDVTSMPYLSNEYLVWSEDRTIFIYSLNKCKVVETINTNQHGVWTKVNDKYVAWEANGSLQLKRIGDNEKVTIAKDSVFFFDIGNDYIVWQSNSKHSSSILAYSISKNKTEIITSSGMFPYIRDNHLIWETRDENNKVIFHIAELL